MKITLKRKKENPRFDSCNNIWHVDDATEPLFGTRIGHPVVLKNIHSQHLCAGQHCVVHNPSKHRMRDWPIVWRADKRIVERMCKHGVGHPDPDDAAFLNSQGKGYLTIHGCDGCCRKH